MSSKIWIARGITVAFIYITPQIRMHRWIA